MFKLGLLTRFCVNTKASANAEANGPEENLFHFAALGVVLLFFFLLLFLLGLFLFLLFCLHFRFIGLFFLGGIGGRSRGAWW